jgi:hypothetical protein
LVDGTHYPLIMTKFITGRPHHQEALDRALAQVQQAIAALDAAVTARLATRRGTPEWHAAQAKVMKALARLP